MAGMSDDEEAMDNEAEAGEGYSREHSILIDAGFSGEQASALIEAIEACIDKSSAEPGEGEEPAKPGPGKDTLALIFGGKGGKK